MTLHLNVYCVVYLEVLVIVEHLDNILFFHYSKILKNIFRVSVMEEDIVKQ